MRRFAWLARSAHVAWYAVHVGCHATIEFIILALFFVSHVFDAFADDVNDGGDHHVGGEKHEQLISSDSRVDETLVHFVVGEAAICGGANSAGDDPTASGRTHLLDHLEHLVAVPLPQHVGVVGFVSRAVVIAVVVRYTANLADDSVGDVVDVLVTVRSHVVAPFESFLPHDYFDHPWLESRCLQFLEGLIYFLYYLSRFHIRNNYFGNVSMTITLVSFYQRE